MSRKTDKKRARHVDIILLSEIITDSMYWQAICNQNSFKFGIDLEHIINFTEVHIISINLLSANFCFFGIPISRIYSTK